MNMRNLFIRYIYGFIILLLSASSLISCSEGGNEGNYSVHTGSWTHPSGLTDYISPGGESANNPQVAMGNSGNAVITWAQSDGANDQIFISEYRNDTWTFPTALSDNISPNGENATVPRVAMDDNGNTIVVWQQDVSTIPQIFISEKRDGAWSFPSGLTDNISPDTQNAVFPQVAMDNRGNAVITWLQFDGANDQVFMSEYRNDSWKHPSGVTDNISPDTFTAYSPYIAMDTNGNSIITWTQDSGAEIRAYKSEYRIGSWTSDWIHPINLASDNISPLGTGAISDLSVAMNDAGDAFIVWYQSNTFNFQIFMSQYRNGSWKHPSDLNDNISLDGQDATLPQVAMDNSGNAIIAWQQSDGANNQIFMSEYRNGSWKHPSSLTDNISPDGQNAYLPRVAMDNSGNAIISWLQSDGTNAQVFMSEYRNGSWKHPSALTDNISPDGENAYTPDIAMDDNGNAIIVWRQSYGSTKQVYKSEYR